jgi:hypothetical protein
MAAVAKPAAAAKASRRVTPLQDALQGVSVSSISYTFATVTA